MSEYFMEQPENAEARMVQEDVHQRVPNNYRLKHSRRRDAPAKEVPPRRL